MTLTSLDIQPFTTTYRIAGNLKEKRIFQIRENFTLKIFAKKHLSLSAVDDLWNFNPLYGRHSEPTGMNTASTNLHPQAVAPCPMG